MLSPGDKAPDFELSDAEGRKIRLSDLRGKKVVLYFYPKDDTPGCTIEACSFRDDLGEIEGKNAVVMGVSLDNGESHRKFIEKYMLNFTLITGTKEMAAKYGAYGNKGIFGMGIKRTTYIIDEAGKIEKAFGKVKAKGHSREIIELLK